jgi:hypothetical protein
MLLCPVKAGRPASIAKIIPPSAYRSERSSPRSVRNCSGAELRCSGRGQLGGTRHGERGLDEPGDPQVDDLHQPVAGEDDVVGLDVAVDGLGPVGGLQRGADAAGDGHGTLQGERTFGLETRRESLAVHLLHDQEQQVVVDAPVVQGGDVGVDDLGSGHRLALEPPGQV